MKLIHLSDLHLRAPGITVFGSDPAARLSRALALIRRDHADAAFYLCSGDLADAGEPAAYAELARQLASLPMPAHLMPGNHDARAALRAAFPALRADAQGFLQQGIATPVGRFVLLDTLDAGRPGGAFDTARAAWLADELAASAPAPVFLAMHHPPFAVGIPSMDRYALRDTSALMDALQPHWSRLRHLFIGHLHRPLGGSWGGLPFSGVASPNHQVALDLVSAPANGDVPGCAGHPGFAVVLIEAETVVVQHTFLAGDDAEFML